MCVLPIKKKKEVSVESHAEEKPGSSEHKPILWTCTVSAPEMILVLYNLNGFPLYHVRDYLSSS